METTLAKERLKINILKWYFYPVLAYMVLNAFLFTFPFFIFSFSFTIKSLIHFLIFMVILYILLKIQLRKKENKIYFSDSGIYQGNNFITWEALKIDKVKHIWPTYEETIFLSSQLNSGMKVKFDVGFTNDESFMNLIKKYCPTNTLLFSYSIDYTSRKKNCFFIKKSKIFL